MTNSKLIPIGKIARATGIKGDVKVFVEKCYRSYVLQNKKKIKIFLEGEEKPLSFALPREEVKFLVFSISGINSRTLAENIEKKTLFCYEEELPKLEEDEFYYSALKNLPIYENEKHIGKIKDISNYGAGDIIEVELLTGETVLYPFSKDIFISITKNKVIVTQPKIN